MMKKLLIAVGLAALAATGAAMSTPDGGSATQAGANLNSFMPETVVVRGDGTRDRIKNLSAGQQVLATDPATGQTTKETIEQVIVGQGLRHMYGIDIDGAPTSERILATAGHAFFVRGKGHTPVERIERGDALVQPGGQFVLVRQVLDLGDRDVTVYNLRVSGPHTFTIVSNRQRIITFGA